MINDPYRKGIDTQENWYRNKRLLCKFQKVNFLQALYRSLRRVVMKTFERIDNEGKESLLETVVHLQKLIDTKQYASPLLEKKPKLVHEEIRCSAAMEI